ncbi:MAG: hypothetical protein ACREX0_04765 [Noviherbaspirillum sp.]
MSHLETASEKKRWGLAGFAKHPEAQTHHENILFGNEWLSPPKILPKIPLVPQIAIKRRNQAKQPDFVASGTLICVSVLLRSHIIAGSPRETPNSLCPKSMHLMKSLLAS